MLPYWLMFGAAALGALFYGEPRRGHMPVMLIIAAVVLSLLIGLRFHVGGDWRLYSQILHSMLKQPFWDALWLPSSDPAYSMLNWVSAQLGIEIWLPNLVCGALLMWGVTTLALRQPNPWIVFVVAIPYLIIVVGMGYTRQAAAIGLTMVSIYAAIDKKLIKFIICMILAATFHKSAIIMLPMVALVLSESRALSISLLILLGLFLFVILVSARLDFLRNNYLREGLQSAGAGQRIAINAFPSVIFLLAHRRFGFDERERVVWRNIALASLGAVAGLVLSSSSTVVDRLVLYLTPIQLVIFARLPWALGGGALGRTMTIIAVIAGPATILFVWLNYADNASLWLPYRLYPL